MEILAAIWVFARRYRANQHICATRQCLLGQVWTFFRTKCEGRLDMNQLARGEAPYRGEPFLGLAGRGVDQCRRPFLIGSPCDFVVAQCDEKFIQRRWISMLWIG